MADREATLTIRIGAQISEALNGINKLGDRVTRFGNDMGRTGKMLSRNITAPIVGAGAAAVAAAVRFGNMSDELLDLEQATGLTTDSLQVYRQIARVAGVEQDVFADAAKKMQQSLRAVGPDSAATAAAFEYLGVEMRDTTGKLRGMDQMLPEVLNKLAGMEDVTERNVLATQLFGRGAAKILPALRTMGSDFAAVEEEARALGLILSRDALEAGNNFRMGVDRLKASAGGIANEFAIVLVPILEDVVDVIQSHVVPAVRKVVAFLAEVDGPLLRMVMGFAAVVAAIGPFLLVAGKVVAVLGMVLNPVGLVIAAIAALGAIVFTVVRNWDRFVMFWLEAWRGIQTTAINAIDKVLGGLEALYSNIPGLGRLVTAAREKFNDLATGGLDKTDEALARVRARMSEAAEGMVETIDVATLLDVELDELADTSDRVTESFSNVTRRGEEMRREIGSVETAVVGVRDTLDLVPVTLGRVGAASTTTFTGISRRVGLTADESAAALQRLSRQGSDAMVELGRTVNGIAQSAERSLVDSMFRAGQGFKAFVTDALKQLARLAASQVFKRVIGMAAGGPLGAIFAGAFADGGVIGARRFGLVGEAGPEFVSAGSAPLRITPMGDVGGGGGGGGGDAAAVASAILAGLGPAPSGGSPEVLALDQWYRRLFSAMAEDGRRRGVL